jgi:hypothetical protein
MQDSEKLTKEQFEAIVAWANIYGRTWKRELSLAWFNGDYGYGNREISGYLQQIRNDLGPEWLVKFNLKKAQAQYEAGLQPPHLRVIL